MMRSVVLAAMACGLAACGPGKSAESAAGGTSPAEEKLAEAIVEAGGVIAITDDTIKQVAMGQVQMVAYNIPDLKQEQGEALVAAVEKNIAAAVPDLKKQMAAYLTETLNEKELKIYHDFIVAREGESIKDRMPGVMEQSIGAADAMTSTAMQKAMEELKIVIPPPPEQQALPPAGPAPTNVPPGVLKPTKPQ